MRYRFGLLLCVVALSASHARGAEIEIGAASITGSNELRGEYIENDGSALGSPYRDEGFQFHDNLHFDMLYRPGRYSLWRGQFFGVLNASDYRSPYRGLVPERLAMLYESGEHPQLPFRLEAGDYFADYSYRTLQRSVKGLQLELQPGWAPRGIRQSLVFSAASGDNDWRDLDSEQELLGGVSWLLEFANTASLSGNFVHDRVPEREGHAALDQNVSSLTMEFPFRLHTHTLSLESEVAHFSGDHEDIDATESGSGKSDLAYFVQCSGHDDNILKYRFRFEQYGLDFLPYRSAVPSNVRNYEGQLGLRSASGLSISTRLQQYRVGIDDPNPEDTALIGVTLNGPMLGRIDPKLIADLNGTVQHLTNANDTIDTTAVTVRARLSRQLGRSWLGQIGYFNVDSSDEYDTAAANQSTQVDLQLNYRFRLGGFGGTFTPGLTYQEQRNASDASSWAPSIGLMATGGRHTYGLNMNYRQQEIDLAGSDPNRELNLALRYGYRYLRHHLGLEAHYIANDHGSADETDTYRFVFSYRFQFDKTVARIKSAAAPKTPLTEAAAPALGPMLLTRFPIGYPIESALMQMQEAGLGDPIPFSGASVYNFDAFDTISQPQRFVLLHDAGQVTGTALIIDFDASSGILSDEQIFRQVKAELLRSFSRPDREIEEGAFAADISAAVGRGTFIRASEWDLANGTLRFGIPRRLDGRIRMEIRFGRDLPPESDLWGIEVVQ